MPVITEEIYYKTENESKCFEDIMTIKQRIGNNHSRFSLGFFSYHEKLDKPYYYTMEISNSSLELSKVKINSIKILANKIENNIDLTTISLDEARFSFTKSFGDTEAITDLLKKNITNELSFKISLPDWYDIDYIKTIDYYRIYFYDIPIDHKKMENLMLVYSIEIELLNGEKYKIEESVIYNRFKNKEVAY
jgi:hypothetical protein